MFDADNIVSITGTVKEVHWTNPHAVIFIDDPHADLLKLAEKFGPALEVDPLFPKRAGSCA